MPNIKLITEEGNFLKSQSLFEIIATDLEDYIEVMFIDFDHDKINRAKLTRPMIRSQEEQFGTISPEIIRKQIKLKKISIKIDDSNSILLHLQREYIEIIRDLGIKNKENAPKNDQGDSVFNIKLAPSDVPERKIISKLLNASNYIATDGRIGPAQFTITDEKINDILINNVTNTNMTFIENKEMDDATIILGRKNEFSQPGVFLVLNENSLSKIVYNEIGEKYVILNYEFAVLGFHPEKQFLTLNIKKEN